MPHIGTFLTSEVEPDLTSDPSWPPGSYDATFEQILVPPGRSFLWGKHDYPWVRSVWNWHPEVEVHYIRRSCGLFYVGDHIGEYGPGHLVLAGSNLPHDWVTPGVGPGCAVERIEGRDIVVQLDPARLARAASELCEVEDVHVLFDRARLGLEFGGDTAREGGRLLERMGGQHRLAALGTLLELLALLATSRECRTLASAPFAATFRPDTKVDVERLGRALSYIQARFLDDIRIGDVARHVGLSEGAFSRFFRAQTGNRYSDHVLSLRIWEARRLLADPRLPITAVGFASGFGTITNFNRTFRRRTGMTPSQYRRALLARVPGGAAVRVG